MSDLCAPLYVVMGPEEEELVFWCFVEVMNRMVVCIHHCVDDPETDTAQKQNFLRDQSSMKRQLSTLQDLIAVMDPELYRHLGKNITLSKPYECSSHILQRKPTP